MGCGLIVAPAELPKIAFVNAQHLHFHVDVLDRDGKPLPDVEVSIIRHAFRFDPIVAEVDQAKPDDSRHIDGALDYDCFGNYGVQVTFSKPGYTPVRRFYTADPQVRPQPAIIASTWDDRGTRVDLRTSPRSVVTLLPRSDVPPSRPDWITSFPTAHPPRTSP